MKPYLSILATAFLLTACNSTSDDNKPSNIDTNQSTPVENNTTVVDANESYLLDSLEYSERYKNYRTTESAFEIGNSQSPMTNAEALVPAMCYTEHDVQYNACYVCHQDIIPNQERANKMHDGFLQNEYIFSDYAMKNNWTNLFIDRSAEVAQITDKAIDTYVNTENYTALAPLLEENGFIGYIPDLNDFHLGAEAFNEDGLAKDGSGWVAFNYKPLPSTFWPVNGSTDDVLIRLHKDFRQSADGNYSVETYKFNLAITEAALKDLKTISVPDLDENSIKIDLNGDGALGIVDEINRPDYYVGKASYMPVETFLYPRYTEFLHSVRYIGSTEEGDIHNAPRMKELRYMIKVKSYADESTPYTKNVLAGMYDDEWQEKNEENNAPTFGSLGEKGLDNGMGWWLQAFIEDESGDLRPQTYEETFYCMGCHTNLGSTLDQVFSFARKVDGKDGWGYIDLRKMLDTPNIGETEGEILTYFKRVGGGSEFRAQNDIHDKFYTNGVLDEVKVKSASSIYELITPTRSSALEMNKAYKILVESQDFVSGREGNGKPVENVHKEITSTTPALPADKEFKWDIRLDWSKQ